MTELEAMKTRHAIRHYLTKELEKDKVQALDDEIDKIDKQSGLHIQLVLNEPKAFTTGLAKYGSFKNVNNYLALIGPKGKEEEVGYYGQKLALLAQTLGLNTCWVALTFKKQKSAYSLNKGEKLYIVIALGYGATQGFQHKSKEALKISNLDDKSPSWFKNGLEAALLAPTAMNQQRYYLEFIAPDKVKAKAKFEPDSKIDLGIVKYNFTLGAGETNFSFVE